MGVERPTRLQRFVAFVHLPFSFRSFDRFVASLLFMKGTPYEKQCIFVGKPVLKIFFAGKGRLKGTAHMEAPGNGLLVALIPHHGGDKSWCFHSEKYLIRGGLAEKKRLAQTLLCIWRYLRTIFIFFQAVTVTNSAIWLVLSAVRIFLSLTTVTVTLAWVFFPWVNKVVWERGKK